MIDKINLPTKPDLKSCKSTREMLLVHLEHTTGVYSIILNELAFLKEKDKEQDEIHRNLYDKIDDTLTKHEQVLGEIADRLSDTESDIRVGKKIFKFGSSGVALIVGILTILKLIKIL